MKEHQLKQEDLMVSFKPDSRAGRVGQDPNQIRNRMPSPQGSVPSNLNTQARLSQPILNVGHQQVVFNYQQNATGIVGAIPRSPTAIAQPIIHQYPPQQVQVPIINVQPLQQAQRYVQIQPNYTIPAPIIQIPPNQIQQQPIQYIQQPVINQPIQPPTQFQTQLQQQIKHQIERSPIKSPQQINPQPLLAQPQRPMNVQQPVQIPPQQPLQVVPQPQTIYVQPPQGQGQIIYQQSYPADPTAVYQQGQQAQYPQQGRENYQYNQQTQGQYPEGYPEEQQGQYPEGQQQQGQYYQGQQQEGQYYQGKQGQGSGQSTLWQQRFFYLYEKYQIYYQKVDSMAKQIAFLCQQFLQVDNQQQWMALKQKYDSLTQRMTQTRDQNAMLLQQIQQAIQQNQNLHNPSIKDQAGRVWQHRYQQLLQQYQSLSHHYVELHSSSMTHQQGDHNQQLATMNQKYARLQAQYNHVVQQLQDQDPNQQTVSRQQHEDLLKYTQQMQTYIEQLQSDNNNLTKGLKTSVQSQKQMQHSQMNHKLADKQSQIKNLTHIIVDLQQQLKSREGGMRGGQNQQMHKQMEQMHNYCTELQHKLSLKDYEINGVKDKVTYLQGQIHHKQQQLLAQSSQFHETITKIQTQRLRGDSSRPVGSNNLQQDFEDRIKDYQKALNNKNNQIRTQEERIYELEAINRKLTLQRSGLNFELQDKLSALQQQHRLKIHQRENKTRKLEDKLNQIQAQLRRKVQQKDRFVKQWQIYQQRNRQEIQNSISEKDAVINRLNQTIFRLENELNQKNKESFSFNAQSPRFSNGRQSFNILNVQSVRNQEEFRVIIQQLEKKNQEINKLKRQREFKSKQFRQLENDYASLQDENTRKKAQINNIKRQLSALQDLQAEMQTLRSTLAKRNSQLSQLKRYNSQNDRFKYEIQSKTRQVQTQKDINNLKIRQIQQLKQRNYELQQRIRQAQLKQINVQRDYQPSKKGNFQQLMHLQQQIRNSQIEISKYKLQNEQLNRNLRRTREELDGLRIKNSVKIRQYEEQLSQKQLSLSFSEQKADSLETKNRQLEEFIRRSRESIDEELSQQNRRQKQYYSKYIERQEEQQKANKEQLRAYELQIHNFEVQIHGLNASAKQAQIERGELRRRVTYLNQRLQEKQQETHDNKNTQNTQLVTLRKKQLRVVQLQNQLKIKDKALRQAEKRSQNSNNTLKSIKRQYQQYKHSTIQKLQLSTSKQMQFLNKQIADYESRMMFQNHNFDFKVKDRDGNHTFENRVIYQLKQQNDFLRKQLQGRGLSISLQKIKINRMQHQALERSKNLVKNVPTGQGIQFYKQKNRQLQERVNSHIEVNKNLRERLQNLLQENHKFGQINLLKIKITELQLQVKELNERNNKSSEENRILRKDLNNLSGLQSIKIDYENRLQENARKISQLHMQKNTIQQQFTINRMQKENYRNQCEQYQRQITQLSNQTALLKAEIQRLSRGSIKSDKTSQLQVKIRNLQAQIFSAEGVIAEFQAKMKTKDNTIQGYQETISQSATQINTQNQYISTLERQLREAHQHDSNRQDIQQWKASVGQLQNSLDLMRQRIEQLEQQCQYYKSKGPNQIKGQAFYYLQLLRSNCIQLDNLASQIIIQGQRMQLLAQRMHENSRRGLQSCQFMQAVLS